MMPDSARRPVMRSMTRFVLPPGGILSLKDEFAASRVTAFGPPSLSEAAFNSILGEARRHRAAAWLCEHRGDMNYCDQHNWRAELGRDARELLSSRESQSLLQAVTGTRVGPSYESSCFTYYDSPEDFLSVHRDRPTSCAVTLLIYLEATWPSTSRPSQGLGLQVFSLGAPPESPPLLAVTARPNRAVILQGSELPHCRTNLARGESVSLLSACFSPIP